MTTKKKVSTGTLVKGEGLILVVDDEPIMRKLAVNVLKQSGYTVIAVEDGDKAIQIYKQRFHEIKLVLLDLLMPVKSGKETYVELKKINPDVRVILVSGVEPNNQIKELLKMGINGYIEKPYTFPQLSHLAYKLINQS